MIFAYFSNAFFKYKLDEGNEIKFLADAVEGGEPHECLLELFVEFLAGHDLDVPAAQLASQSHVLATTTDGKRQLIFLDKHDCPADHVTKQHLFDFRGLKCIGNHHLGIVIVTHHIYMFPGELFADRLDSASPITHTYGNRVNLAVHAADGNFASITGFTAD